MHSIDSQAAKCVPFICVGCQTVSKIADLRTPFCTVFILILILDV